MSRLKPDILVAYAVTWVLNPFFVLPLALVASNLNLINADPWPFIMFLFVGLFPMFFYYLYEEYKHKEKAWEFFINLPRERRNGVLLIAIYTFIFNTIIFATLGSSFWEKTSILFAIFAAVMYLANRYLDKASWHAGILAFGIFYAVDKISINLALLLLLLPVVYWSRVLLHKHTWLQLYLGTVIGLVIGLLSWTIH